MIDNTDKKKIIALYILAGSLTLFMFIYMMINLWFEASTPESASISDMSSINTLHNNNTNNIYANINDTANKINITDLTNTAEIILSEEEITEQKIDAMIKNMTLEQKIGQMFFCAFRKDNNGGDIVEINEDIKKIIRGCNIGGVILFSENIKEKQQVTDYICDLQKEADIALFIGIDEEGGRVLRTENLDVPRISSALNIGKTGDVKNAYDAAKTIADYLSPLGFNVDFAPVADVFTNPSNTVIGDRAFSSDPNIAGEMVKSFSQGLVDNKILPAIKHFPGHGDTGEDSHYGTAVSKKTLGQLSECEFIPFKMGIESNVPFVMAGHISTPDINNSDSDSDSGENNLPAVFSRFLLRDILRGALGFNGIIITDSLSMGAITNYYSSEETAVKSILAGVDILLMPEDFYGAYYGVINAVNSGKITEERIDESVKRIFTVKYNAGLIK